MGRDKQLPKFDQAIKYPTVAQAKREFKESPAKIERAVIEPIREELRQKAAQNLRDLDEKIYREEIDPIRRQLEEAAYMERLD